VAHVFITNWEAEFGRIVIAGWLRETEREREKFVRPHLNGKKAEHGASYLSSQRWWGVKNRRIMSQTS
jgi:hypothetical protein